MRYTTTPSWTGVERPRRRRFTAGGQPDAAETVRLLAELDRLHADGTPRDDQFDALKRKLLGET